MLQTYITAVPLQGQADLAKIAYERPGKPPVPTRFPILQVIRDTLAPGDEAKVIAIRQKSGDTARNYALFLQELAQVGIAESCVQQLALPQDQSPQVLLNLCQQLTAAIPAQTRAHACITYGTKSIPIVIFAALNCAEATHTEVEIGRLCYGEIQRENGRICSSHLCDMAALYQLSGLVGSTQDPQTAKQVFDQLLWMNTAQKGNLDG